MSESAEQVATSPASAGLDEGSKDQFSVLEQRIEALVDRHREALAKIEDLRAQIVGRDRRISELRGQVAAQHHVRNEVLRRVERLISRVDELEAMAARLDGDAAIESAVPEGTA